MSVYSLAILLAIWYKLRKARDQKLELEMEYFSRVDSVMARLANMFKD